MTLGLAPQGRAYASLGHEIVDAIADERLANTPAAIGSLSLGSSRRSRQGLSALADEGGNKFMLELSDEPPRTRGVRKKKFHAFGDDDAVNALFRCR